MVNLRKEAWSSIVVISDLVISFIVEIQFGVAGSTVGFKENIGVTIKGECYVVVITRRQTVGLGNAAFNSGSLSKGVVWFKLVRSNGTGTATGIGIRVGAGTVVVFVRLIGTI